jgi:hypothetical protein
MVIITNLHILLSIQKLQNILILCISVLLKLAKLTGKPMSIKIKFSFDELRRRAAKMLDVHPSYIDNVCPSGGGTKFYVLYRGRTDRGYSGRGATFTIWQTVILFTGFSFIRFSPST